MLVLGLIFVLKIGPKFNAANITARLTYQLQSVSILKLSGGNVDWSRSGSNLIVYDQKQPNGYYSIFTMQPNGSNVKCLTCNNTNLPNRNMGNAAWSPDGKWIIFQAEKATHIKPSSAISVLPGGGELNDLWIMSSDGSRVYQLTNEPNTVDSGVLEPHFSNDGTKLTWVEKYRKENLWVPSQVFGDWKLKVADFKVVSGAPQISNIKTFQPGNEVFYESHGFSADNSKIIFTSNFYNTVHALTNSNVYTLNLNTGAVVQLTSQGYNEHAIYSPDSQKIVWMSSSGEAGGGRTEYWLMNQDGSGKTQLTHFNTSGYLEYSGGTTITAADSSWGPYGSRIVGYVQNNLLQQTGSIVMINLQ